MKQLVAWCMTLALVSGALGAGNDAVGDDPYAANACVQCHRDLPGRSSEIVLLEWRHSAHYRANVGCDGCHGGNPAVRAEQFKTPEEFKQAAHLARTQEFLVMHAQEGQFVSAARGRSVSYFCGKCHAAIKEKHLGSPHGDFGDPTCLYCHGQGSHLIPKPTPEILDTRSRAESGRCSPCHRAATMEVVSRIKKTLLDTQKQIESSGELYAQLEEWGYHNLELEQLHHHGKEVNSQLRQIFHSFNMREINNFAAEIQATVDRTTASHQMIEHLRRTRLRQSVVGFGVVTLLLVFAGTLVYYKKSFLDPLHESSHEKPEN